MAVKRLESRIFNLNEADKTALALMPYRSKETTAVDRNSPLPQELHVFDLLNGAPFSLNVVGLRNGDLNE